MVPLLAQEYRERCLNSKLASTISGRAREGDFDACAFPPPNISQSPFGSARMRREVVKGVNLAESIRVNVVSGCSVKSSSKFSVNAVTILG